MKRSGFHKPQIERRRSIPTPGTGRGVHVLSSDVPVVVEKREYVRSEALREAYRLIPCMWTSCGIEDGTVCCAHSNWQDIGGKGGHIKADDSRGAALCSVHHSALDQGSAMSYEERKAGWLAAHGRSVRELLGRGLWPKDVPVPEDAVDVRHVLWFTPKGYVFA